MPKKERVGKVVSSSMDKTAVVILEDKKTHPRYKKVIAKSKKVKAHDEKNECNVGDTVKILEHTPISRDKCWKIVEIIEKAV